MINESNKRKTQRRLQRTAVSVIAHATYAIVLRKNFNATYLMHKINATHATQCLRYEVVAVQKLMQSPLYNSIQWLREERQIRYRSVVLHLAGVQPALLQQWTNYGSLEVGLKTPNSQWLVAQSAKDASCSCSAISQNTFWASADFSCIKYQCIVNLNRYSRSFSASVVRFVCIGVLCTVPVSVCYATVLQT